MQTTDFLKNINVPYIVKEYEKDMVIYHEGEMIFDVGFVLSGSISIFTITYEGFEFEILKMNDNNIFADALIFKDKPVLPGFIKAYKDTKIMFIKRDDFKTLLSTNRDFLFKYLEYVSSRSSHQQYKIKLLGQPSIREKILFYLKEEIKKTGTNKVILSMSKEKLAIMLGVNRPSLSRELIRMKNDGIIDYDRKSITFKK